MTQQRLVFVGTYTEPIRFGTGKILQGKGQGIHVYAMDAATGAMTPRKVAAGVRNPSYLAFDPAQHFLYAVNELKEYEGAASGAVSAFALDRHSGELTFLNQKPSHGTDPCHLTVDPTGKNVLIANFMSGSVCVLSIHADGSLGDASDFVQHQGSSVDPLRQSGPHAHAVTLDNAGRMAFIPDLGLDRLMIYKFDPERGKLAPNDQPWVEVVPGAGPRQVVMHPDGHYAYLINELNSTMTAYRYDAQRGRLTEVQTLSTLPAGFTGSSTCAEVQIAPSGKYLYGSNRGHDSIVTYAVNPNDGTLTLVGHESTQGKTPRNFMVSPDGAYLMAANQDTDSIVTFRLDPATGRLVATGIVTEAPTPVCVRVL